MDNINVLVFPCGSEVALEIHRSLKFSRHVTLFGANSISDHGRFVFENYTGDLPFITDDTFINKLAVLVKKLNIDAIYPAMDGVINILKENEGRLGCKVIGAPVDTTNLCLSKSLTYSTLRDVVHVPKVYNTVDEVPSFPVFMKPSIGYGSRGAKKVFSTEQIALQLKDYSDSILMEYLPGEEYTIDCFTDRNGKLLFSGARVRQRISNGISVNTIPVEDDRFKKFADKLNKTITFRGAWFFQIKKNKQGDLVLLEVASRMGGSSALYRNKGINFALLSVFDYMNVDVDIVENRYNIELDRALDNKYKINITYDIVYVDFDDCLIINEKVNDTLVCFLYQALNKGKRIVLLTKHIKDINESLQKYRLTSIFDEVIHIDKTDSKYKYINSSSSIFIDDSFVERKSVANEKGIPVFSPDMVESLLN